MVISDMGEQVAGNFRDAPQIQQFKNLGCVPEIPWLYADEERHAGVPMTQYERIGVPEMQIPDSADLGLPTPGGADSNGIVAAHVRINVLDTLRLHGLENEITYGPVDSAAAVLRFGIPIVDICLVHSRPGVHLQFRNKRVVGAYPARMRDVIIWSDRGEALIAFIEAFHGMRNHVRITGPAGTQ